jgi:putative FmdB family regulatory protein
MATYEFRCPECSVFEVVVPMSAVRPTHACPACSAESPRVFSSPALARTPGALHRAVDTAEASAEAPRVVRSIPAGAPRPRAPRWSPFTGAPAVNAAHRPAGPHPSLPRW